MGRIFTSLFVTASWFALLLSSSRAAPSVTQETGSFVQQHEVQDALPWYKNLNNAIAIAKEEYRPVIIFFHVASDGWSNRMRAEIFADEAVKKQLEHYIRVEISLEDDPEIARKYFVQGVPSIRILSAEGRLLQGKDNFIHTPEMLRMLRASLNAEFLRKSDPEFQTLLNQLQENEIPPETWPEVMIHLGEPPKRESLRQLILQLDPFPRTRFVELLSDQRLAVRLGALELLEEISGNDFDFDPWVVGEHHTTNLASIEKWSQWAGSTEGEEIVKVFSVLDEDQIGNYIRDLIGDHPERSRRARSMLRTGGKNVAHALQGFLEHNTSATTETRKAIRELYYSLTVPPINGSNPDAIARRLVHGNLDSRLAAITTLKGVGRKALPVLADFLNDPDPLIRETTIDAILTAGSNAALPIVKKHLQNESEKAVTLSALRSIGINEIRPGTKLVASYASSEDEDIAIMALESLGGLRAQSEVAVIAQELKDTRWRVRIAALETIGRLKDSGFTSSVRPLLRDKDEFVCAAAINTLAKLKDKGSRQALIKLYQKKPDLRAPIIEALVSLELPLPNTLVKDLKEGSPDTILAVIDAISDSSARNTGLVAHFLDHENIDVASAATRYIAKYGLYSHQHQQQITDILKGKDPAKALIALESVRFNEEQSNRFSHTRSQGDSSPKFPADVQRVYDSFLERAPRNNQGAINDPLISLFQTIETYLSEDKDAKQRFHAALVLAQAGVPEATEILLSTLKTKSVSQRKEVARSLDSVPEGGLPLLVALLRDPSSEVRSYASDAILDQAERPAFLTAFFNELTRPSRVLQPRDVDIYDLKSALDEYASKQIANRAAKQILADSINPKLHSFAALILQFAGNYGDSETLLQLTKSDTPETRRAAWLAIGFNNANALRPHFEDIAKDPSERVRSVLPILLTQDSNSITHYFDEEHSDTYYLSRYDRTGFKGGRLNPDDKAVLEILSKDHSPTLRIDSAFVLMTDGETPDPQYLEETLSSFPDKDSIERKVSDYLESHFRRLPKDYAFLVNYLDPDRISDDDEVRQIYDHFGASPAEETATTHFDWSPRATQSPDPDTTKTTNTPRAQTTEIPPIELVYFYNPGCKECDRVKRYLDEMQSAFPRLEITSHNLRKAEAAQLNEALSERFGVPEKIRTVAPAVFTEEGYLIKDRIQPTRLGNLIERTSASGRSLVGWADLKEAEASLANEAIENRFDTLRIPVILLAGLLDGVNPCAFATIILFLSYLQIAKHTPRQILAVGLSFISAVFFTYLALGLGLVEVVSRLQFLKGVAIGLNIVLAIFALVIMIYSIRDGILCLQGRLADTTLQLPAFLKDRIRKVARKGARHRRYVIAAFVSGVVISVLELTCTGQVYLPTINIMLQQGKKSAYGMLVIYNLAFILPLVIIFILAFFGLKSDALIRFQNKHSAAIKFATAALFLALFLLLLYQILR